MIRVIRRLMILFAIAAGACRPAAPPPRAGGADDPGVPPRPAAELNGVPPEVVASLSTCEVTASLIPAEDEAPGAGSGMRSVRLRVRGEGAPATVDAYSRWADGSLRTAGAELRPRFMGKALAALARAGLFERGGGGGEAAPPGDGWVLELVVTVADDRGGRRRWSLGRALDEAALEPLWDLAVEVHANPDILAYAHLSALYNRAVDAIEGAAAAAP